MVFDDVRAVYVTHIDNDGRLREQERDNVEFRLAFSERLQARGADFDRRPV